LAFSRGSWLILLFVIVACGVSSCASDSSHQDQATLNELLAAGKQYLAENRGEDAAAAFRRAWSLDAESTDAQYGLFLANIMQFANFVDQILGTINGLNFQSGLSAGDAPLPTGGEITTCSVASDDDYADPIHNYLREFIVPQIVENETLYAALAQAPELRFALGSYPIQINKENLLEFGGEFDRVDLHFFGAVNALLHGLLQFILAYDLRFDFTVLQLPELGADAPLTDTIDMIVDLLDALLSSETFPTFLRLMPETGAADLQTAGIDFGNAFARLSLAWSMMARESGARADNQFGYNDLNHNGRYDGNAEPAFMGRTAVLDPQLALAVWDLSDVLTAVFYEGSPADADPTHANLLRLSDLNDLLAALGVLPLSLGSLEIDGLPSWIGLNVGAFFSDPTPDELRQMLELVIKIWELVG